ncbi:MAG: GC-type dockerin domain-anchored protein [Phycisphaerales bacterium]
MFMKYCCSALALVSFGVAAASAQTVTIKVFGDTNLLISTQTVATGNSATVNLGSAVSDTRTIRIYDSATTSGGTATASLGKLTIMGSATSTARVNILISRGDTFNTAGSPVFPSTAAQIGALNPGLRDFGGSSIGGTRDFSLQSHDYDTFPAAAMDLALNTVGNQPPSAYDIYDPDGNLGNGIQPDAAMTGLIIPDPSLRRQTVLAAVVAHDICPGYDPINQIAGRIEVGQVLRLAALGEIQGNSVLYGNLNAHVIAVSRDTYLTYGNVFSPPTAPGFGTLPRTTTAFHAIEAVSAGNAIRGKIIAFGRAKDDSGNDFPQFPDPEPLVPADHAKWLDKFWINRGSIFNVRVGPISVENGGIRNDILAPMGRIYSVRSTGPIKTLADTIGNDKISILANDGVLEVRVAGEDTVVGGQTVHAAPLDHPLKASITASQVGLFQHRVPPDYRDEGVVNLVDTAGQFHGSIHCENMVFNPAITDALGRGGVIAAGTPIASGGGIPNVYANNDAPDIYVHSIARNVSILSYHLHLVSVGWQFKGTMVAFGTHVLADNQWLTGSIYSLDIGMIGSVEQTEHEFYPGIVRGFVGGYSPPMDMRPGPFNNQTSINDPTAPTLSFVPTGNPNDPQPVAMPWDADRWLYAKPTHSSVGEDGGSLDSVIRAERMIEGKPLIYQMTQHVVQSGEDRKEEVAPYRPRLETPECAEGLQIEAQEVTTEFGRDYLTPQDVRGGLLSGVVWSGKLEYIQSGGNWVIDESHGAAKNDFVKMSKAYIGRIGPAADLWVRGDYEDALNPRGPEIGDDVCGEIHVNSQLGRWVLPINGKLGDRADWTSASPARWDDEWTWNGERSPRGLPAISPGSPPLYESVAADRGAVRIWRTPEVGSDFVRFEGPIVINGWAVNAPPPPNDPGQPSGTFWKGIVRIGDPFEEAAANVVTLGPSSVTGVTSLDIAPQYDRLGSALTGRLATGTAVNDQVRQKLRGGGVGVVPYAVDDLDCNPPNVSPTNYLNAGTVSYLDWMHQLYNPSVVNDRNTPRIWLRFYGSLKYDSGLSVRIERLDNPTAPAAQHTWSDMTDRFRTLVTGEQNEWHPFLEIFPACYDSGDDPSQFAVKAGIYRVRNWWPNTDPETQSELPIVRADLRCMYGKGHPYVADFTYYFRLSSVVDIGHAGGFEGADGLLDNNDFIVFINWFFGPPTCTPACPDSRADIGHSGGYPGADGQLNNNDYIAFITLYFAGQSAYNNHTPDNTFYSVPCEWTPNPIITGPPYGEEEEQDGGQSMMAGRAGGEQSSTLNGEDQSSAVAYLRAMLLSMIAEEPEGPQRDRLIQVLNSLSPTP